MERALDPRTESTVADLYLNDIVGASAKLKGTANSVSGIRVLDDYTLEITIDAPKPYFLAKLTYSTAFVVDQENVESGPDWTSRPNGTGAFRLAEWEIGERIRLERNDLYYKEPAHLDAVNLLLSGGVGMTMYENNEIDFTGVGLADIDRVLDPTEAINRDLQITPPDYSVSYFGLNTQMAPFDDIKVRKALALAINKELIAEAVLSNLVVPAYGILPPGFPGHNQNLQGIRFDIEEAMRTLAESSYGRGDAAIAELAHAGRHRPRRRVSHHRPQRGFQDGRRKAADHNPVRPRRRWGRGSRYRGCPGHMAGAPRSQRRGPAVRVRHIS